MTDDLTAELARLNELNAKRTPGEWTAGVHPGNHRLNIIKPITFGKYVGKLPDCEGGHVYFRDAGTAQFIAAAPDAVALANKLHEAWESVSSALAQMDVSYDNLAAEYERLKADNKRFYALLVDSCNGFDAIANSMGDTSPIDRSIARHHITALHAAGIGGSDGK